MKGKEMTLIRLAKAVRDRKSLRTSLDTATMARRFPLPVLWS